MNAERASSDECVGRNKRFTTGELFIGQFVSSHQVTSNMSAPDISFSMLFATGIRLP